MNKSLLQKHYVVLLVILQVMTKVAYALIPVEKDHVYLINVNGDSIFTRTINPHAYWVLCNPKSVGRANEAVQVLAWLEDRYYLSR